MRALVQPWVTCRVHAKTATILRFQIRQSLRRCGSSELGGAEVLLKGLEDVVDTVVLRGAIPPRPEVAIALEAQAPDGRRVAARSATRAAAARLLLLWCARWCLDPCWRCCSGHGEGNVFDKMCQRGKLTSVRIYKSKLATKQTKT